MSKYDDLVKQALLRAEKVKAELAARKMRSNVATSLPQPSPEDIQEKSKQTQFLLEDSLSSTNSSRNEDKSKSDTDAVNKELGELIRMVAQLRTVLAEPDLFMEEVRRDTDPSPPPVYDAQGRRINTKEQRVKEKIEKELQACQIQILEINRKKKVKVYLPADGQARYSGFLIGPRGSNLRRIEQEVGHRTKIMIRGRGTIKEGKEHRPEEYIGADDDPHVLITSDDEAALNASKRMIEWEIESATSSAPEAVRHRRQQLDQLAAYNGTLRDGVSEANLNLGGNTPQATLVLQSIIRSVGLSKADGEGSTGREGVEQVGGGEHGDESKQGEGAWEGIQVGAIDKGRTLTLEDDAQASEKKDTSDEEKLNEDLRQFLDRLDMEPSASSKGAANAPVSSTSAASFVSAPESQETNLEATSTQFNLTRVVSPSDALFDVVPETDGPRTPSAEEKHSFVAVAAGARAPEAEKHIVQVAPRQEESCDLVLAELDELERESENDPAPLLTLAPSKPTPTHPSPSHPSPSPPSQPRDGFYAPPLSALQFASDAATAAAAAAIASCAFHVPIVPPQGIPTDASVYGADGALLPSSTSPFTMAAPLAFSAGYSLPGMYPPGITTIEVPIYGPSSQRGSGAASPAHGTGDSPASTFSGQGSDDAALSADSHHSPFPTAQGQTMNEKSVQGLTWNQYYQSN